MLSLILRLKRESRPISARLLAHELEVSTRTILRDVDALSTAGIPVYCERGAHGGIALAPGSPSDLTDLTDGELGAVVLALRATRSLQLGRQAPLGSALAKLLATIPEQRRETAYGLASRIVVDPEGWLPGSRTPWLAEAHRAVTHRRMVRFRYQSAASGRTERVTSPAVGLLSAAGTWYLAGLHETRARFFRLERIDDFEVEEGEVSPADYDVETRWRDARARFRERFAPMSAVLALSSRALARLRGSCSILEVGKARPRGWHQIDAEFGDLSHACEVLAPIAAELRVIDPPVLREALRAQAKALLRAARGRGSERSRSRSGRSVDRSEEGARAGPSKAANGGAPRR